jgi:four helix bundle protein
LRPSTVASATSPAAPLLGKQLLRSEAFIGVNYREAQRGRSKAELMAKCGNSLEEVASWRELLVDGEIVPATKLQPPRAECDELTAIFVTIITKARGGGSQKAE